MKKSKKLLSITIVALLSVSCCLKSYAVIEKFEKTIVSNKVILSVMTPQEALELSKFIINPSIYQYYNTDTPLYLKNTEEALLYGMGRGKNGVADEWFSQGTLSYSIYACDMSDFGKKLIGEIWAREDENSEDENNEEKAEKISKDKTIKIGFWIREEFQNKGYGFSAAKLLVEEILKHKNSNIFNAIEFTCHENNISSNKLVEKIVLAFNSAIISYEKIVIFHSISRSEDQKGKRTRYAGLHYITKNNSSGEILEDVEASTPPNCVAKNILRNFFPNTVSWNVISHKLNI